MAMSRTLFENSKAALAFAGVTIFGAVVMVGSSESGGVLDQLVERFSHQREAISTEAREFAESQSVGDAERTTVSDPDAGWGSSTAVFGDYTPGARQSAVSPPSRSASKQTRTGMIPGAQPVVADSEGIAVPRPDESLPDGLLPDGLLDAGSPPPVPVITARQMTIEPQ